MSDNEQKQDIPSSQELPQSPEAVTDEAPIQPADSTPIELPSEAPEAPRDAFTPVPVEDQNGAVNEPENKEVELPKEPEIIEEAIPEPIQTVRDESAPAPRTPQAPQPQSLAQQDERGFIKSLIIKAQAKIQFNKQKKLDKLIQLAQKKQIITNDDVQKLLRVSDATATRYLVKLVQQGRLTRVGSPRDAKYQFVR
jgi:hypothetical protein